MRKSRFTGELIALGSCVGALGGTVLACLEAPGRLRSFDMMVEIAYLALPAALISAVVTCFGMLLLRMLRCPLSRAQWAALQSASLLVGIGLCLVFHADQPGAGLLLMSVSPFASWIVYRLMARHPRFDSAGRPALMALATVLALIWLAGGAAVARELGWPRVGSLLAGCIAVAAVVAVALAARSSPRRSWLALAVAIPASLTALASIDFSPRVPPGASPAPIGELPHVVLIVLDTTRHDFLGPYGGVEGLTPRLDRLAAEGVVYEDVYSTAPWTVPSHASMFTGQHPITHGCSRRTHLPLDERAVTVAEMLGGYGYQSVALYCNSWVKHTNQLQGFEAEFHTRSAANRKKLAGLLLAELIGVPADWTDHGASALHRKLRSWLATERDPDRPLFLFVNMLEAHASYLPPFTERRFLPQEIGWLEARRFTQNFSPARQFRVRRHPEYAERAVSAMYRAAIGYQDKRLGQLLDTLGRSIDLDDTLLIVTADHGENINDGGRWGHEFAVNDAVLHVPLIVRHPGLFPAGTRVSGLAQLVDLLPTIMEVVGHPQPPVTGVSTHSLVPRSFEPRDAVFSEVYPLPMGLGSMEMRAGGKAKLLSDLTAQQRAIRTEQFRYVWYSDGRAALYDLRSDPHEQFNLVEQLPEVAQDLSDQLEVWWDAQPRYVADATEAAEPISDEVLEHLRALGYIE